LPIANGCSFHAKRLANRLYGRLVGDGDGFSSMLDAVLRGEDVCHGQSFIAALGRADAAPSFGGRIGDWTRNLTYCQIARETTERD
jgi:hypothetical protein